MRASAKRVARRVAFWHAACNSSPQEPHGSELHPITAFRSHHGQGQNQRCCENVTGKVKTAVGKATGDEKLKNEGRADQVKGKVQNVVGGVKDSMREADEKSREKP